MLKKPALILYLIFVHALAALFVYETWLKPYYYPADLQVENIKDPTEVTPVPTPQVIPSIEAATPEPEITETETNANQALNNSTNETAQTLMIPVVGIKREQLQDTYNNARSGGRVHNAIDIIAPGGTPVVAASDGEIAKFFYSNGGGGITIYQYSHDKYFIYYYAHLQNRADNIKEHDFVKQGTVIGYVGDTGNSGAGNYHLHFSIGVLTDPKRFFDAAELNPYPILKNSIEAK
ncbi:MAG TPA: M23 family metallopeptidase [Pyrinomonadaceae bacterium]|nr:M23 family metallopeptidase [Pyrinomonadaceae bacterium]